MSTLSRLVTRRGQLAAEDPAFARALQGDPWTDVERWLRAVEVARAEGWHTARALLRLDGVALVRRSTGAGARHTVRVAGGRVVACTCAAGAVHTPCAHAAAVGLRLWEQEMGCDLSEVPARALALTLLRQYVGAPPYRRGRPWGGRLLPDGEPETRYRGPDPAGEFC